MRSLTIAHLYADLLNLYGDTGNVECLVQRCRWRGIKVNIVPIGVGEPALRSSRPVDGSEVGWRGIGVRVVPVGVGEVQEDIGSDPGRKDQISSLSEAKDLISSWVGPSVDIIVSGGGADLGQTIVAKDLQTKQTWLQELADAGVVGLFVCGAYQLMGKYYQAADGSRLEGVGVFDMYTQHFGNDKPRCVGNVVVEVKMGSDPAEKIGPPLTPRWRGRQGRRSDLRPGLISNRVRPYVVGFENHGGRSYLASGRKGLTLDSAGWRSKSVNPRTVPLGKVTKGWGNNGEDGTEGAVYKNFFGTYLHGPVLPKNPHLADLLIGLALERKYGSREDRVGPLGKRRVPGEPGPSRAKWGPTLLKPLDDELEWAAHERAWRTKR